MALLHRVNWTGLDRLVVRQQRNRSAHTPAISLYRWWARRPHSFAGAVLDAAQKEFRDRSFLVADPFSGGGTVAFEARRRGLPMYAQDLYPWPSRSLATALTRVSLDDFKSAVTTLVDEIKHHREAYWRRTNGEIWEITHVLRVRSTNCSACGNRFFLFRDPLISIASRAAEETHAFFGCVACGGVTRRPKGVGSFTCDHCNRRSTTRIEDGNRRINEVECAHCHEELALSDLLQTSLTWHPLLVREQPIRADGSLPRLRQAQQNDPTQDVRGTKHDGLHVSIPNGVETHALKRSGFSFWDQLYTKRQLDTITGALAAVSTVDASEHVKQHLQLAILGATEMAGYVCRWERYHPKALEAIANHRFSRATVTVETNLLSPSGRGTLPRRFQAAERGLRWISAKKYSFPTSYAQSSARRRNAKGTLVVTGSSERQLLKDGAARLVFTDPPYHDDVQYGELARLFHAWMVHTGQCQSALNEDHEAVPNAIRGATTKHYEEKVAACLLESRRTLASDGRLVLTFHNKDLAAWEALAGALLYAKFDVVALATVAAENSADHSKRGKRTFLSDLVIECRVRGRRRRARRLEVSGLIRGAQRKNLAAMGLALAQRVNGAGGELGTLFKTHLKILGARRTLITRGGR
jgi:putative DNA methylase